MTCDSLEHKTNKDNGDHIKSSRRYLVKGRSSEVKENILWQVKWHQVSSRQGRSDSIQSDQIKPGQSSLSKFISTNNNYMNLWWLY